MATEREIKMTQMARAKEVMTIQGLIEKGSPDLEFYFKVTLNGIFSGMTEEEISLCKKQAAENVNSAR